MNGDPFYFRWEDFLPACRDTENIPLKPDHQIPDEQLEDKAPPSDAYTPPTEYLLEPPLLTTMGDDIRPSIHNRYAWFYSDLEPWMQWANTHEDGICTEYVTYADDVKCYIHHSGWVIKYQGYVDSDNKPCGQGSFEWDYADYSSNGAFDTKRKGTGYFWKGRAYGMAYFRDSGSAQDVRS